ncbi:MAG: hypothetical protein QM788_14440 [Roseateles sp.]|uniref:hypothetical protein n=1 Tax=Roseateles sp. TaxID=1971397 RepID=UPI0039E8B0C8
MKEVVGSLNLLGNATINSKNGRHTYTTIEIGENLLQNIIVERSLDNFLERALNLGGKVKLYLLDKYLVGVELPDGKLYYQQSRNLKMFFILLFPFLVTSCSGLIFLTDGQHDNQARNWSLAILIPFGLILLWGLKSWRRLFKAAQTLKAKGGIGISVGLTQTFK